MKTIATKVLVLSLFLPIMSLAAESESQEIEEAAWMRRLCDMNENQRRSCVDSINDIKKKYGEGEQTILNMAAKYGNLELVQLLVKKKADIGQKNKAGNTSLDEAHWVICRTDSPESAKIFNFLVWQQKFPHLTQEKFENMEDEDSLEAVTSGCLRGLYKD